MTLPSEKQTDLQTYLTANTPKPLLEGRKTTGATTRNSSSL